MISDMIDNKKWYGVYLINIPQDHVLLHKLDMIFTITFHFCVKNIIKIHAIHLLLSINSLNYFPWYKILIT